MSRLDGAQFFFEFLQFGDVILMILNLLAQFEILLQYGID
jgi:hypothetical protein